MHKEDMVLQRILIWAKAIGAAPLLLTCCMNSADTTAASAGGGGTDGSASASIASSSGAGGAGGAGGIGGTGGPSFCTQAKDIEFGEVIDGDLKTTWQQDFYRFIGKKGQVVLLDIDAQVVGDHQFDPEYIDPVVTLYNAAGAQIAQNNDPIEFATGDSRLYTILPADGEYCARVAECWTAISNPAVNCAGKKDKLVTSYSVWLYEFVDEPGDPITVDFEAGNDPTTATSIEYDKNSIGYYETTFWGTFEDQDDIDVFSFAMPTDLKPPSDVRTTGRFFIMPSGSNESGSTAPTGKVQVVDAAAPGVVLAEVNAAKNPTFAPRLDLGTTYLLFVTRPKGKTGENDFYFVKHYPSWGNTLELEKGTGANDTLDTAEALTVTNGSAYFEGDIAMNAQDVDHFIATAPDGMTQVWAACKAWGYGSGLRGLTLTLLAGDGSSLADGPSAPEEETKPVRIPSVALTSVPLNGVTQVALKVEADYQEPTITEAFYQCGVHFASK